MANIVHFGKYYMPDAGGIESVTLSLAKGAVAQGHSVSVVCFEKTPAKSQEVIDGVKVFRAPILKLISSQPLGFKYFITCLKAAKAADIVHMHAPNMLAAFATLFIGKKVRLLVHWHSDVVNKGLLGKMLEPLELGLLRRSDVIIAATKAYSVASSRLKKFQHKTKVISYGVSDPIRMIEGVTLPREFEIKLKDKRIILSVGRLVPYKGFDILIEASKYLPSDVVIVIVGMGPLHNGLQQKINDYGVNDRIALFGRLSDVVLNLLYERATLYCLPSTYRAEAFGVVLIEAMAYGLPIVATEIPGSGVPWVNMHGMSGLNVPVKNPISLAGACNQILSSEQLMHKFSSGARQRFISEFTEEKCVKEFMSVYDELLMAK